MTNSKPLSEPDVFIGLMSGTSLDGISAAAVRFVDNGISIRPVLLGESHRPYSPIERVRLQAAMNGGSARDYCLLATDLAHWCSDAAELAVAASRIQWSDVRAVVSHGQTLWHEPGISTWQLDNPAVIAERLRVDVISDLRSRDVAAGGQGAPLVSVADRMCFASSDGWRVLQNIGGMGNLTLVPPAGSDEDVLAFDTGPGVVLIDGTVRAFFPDLNFDVDGVLASQGVGISDIVDSLLSDSWFSFPPPKSTGRETYSADYIEKFIEICMNHHSQVAAADVIATAVLFTARSITDQMDRFTNVPIADVLVSGGGADNPTLMKVIASELAHKFGDKCPDIKHFSDVYFSGSAKESVAFALLGWLHIQGRPGNIPSATGARSSRVLGSLTPAGALS